MSAILHLQPIQAVNKLGELDLNAAVLREAILQGLMHRAGCTSNDPVVFPGMLQWGKTHRGLADGLAPHGWRNRRQDGLDTVQRGDGRVAVAVTTGDSATGDINLTPCSKYPRGGAAARTIRQNMQPLLGYEATPVAPEGVRRKTWLLLLYSTPEMTLCELSLPKSLDRYKRINSWYERIILDPISHEITPAAGKADDEENIEVPVQRKAQ